MAAQADQDIRRQIGVRRAVWALIALAILVPIIWPFGLPALEVAPEVRAVYDDIESLPAGSPLLLSMDFDPASKAELKPMASAVARHAFSRDLRVIGMGLWITGTSLWEEILRSAADEFRKENGRDWAFLGWQPGNQQVIIGLGQSLRTTFPQDYYHHSTTGMRALEGIERLRDFAYVVSISAGVPGVEEWVQYGQEKYRFKLAGGGTGVMAPGLYPYYQRKQVQGIIGAMKGAAEYESLLASKKGLSTGLATAGMVSLSFAHFVLVGLIVLGNVLHLLGRRGAGPGGHPGAGGHR